MSTIKVGDLAICYDAPLGLPSSEVMMLLVHGAGGSSRHWQPLLATALPSFQNQGLFPVAIDLPGHGASEGYVPDSIDAIAQFLNAFLDALGINQPICYVGQSMGGLIGLQFALAYPHRISQLVLMATAARIQLHPDFLQQATTGQWDRHSLRQSFAPTITEDVTELVLNEFKHTRLATDASDFMGVSDVDLNDAIAHLQIPTLILTGDDDVIISPRKSKILHRQISGSHLVTIPDAGHYLHVEQPEAVAAEMMQFLKSTRVVLA